MAERRRTRKTQRGFSVTEKELIARRNGWPDVRIGLSETFRLSHKQPGRLIVASPDKSRLIAIPEDIEGYGNLRSQLARYGEITEVPKRPVPIVTYVPTLLCWFSWALVLFSKEVTVVRQPRLLRYFRPLGIPFELDSW